MLSILKRFCQVCWHEYGWRVVLADDGWCDGCDRFRGDPPDDDRGP